MANELTETYGTPPPALVEETPEQKYARLYPGQATPPPVQVAPPPPAVATLPPELLDTINALKNGFDELKQGMAKKEPEVAPGTPPAWVEKIRVGDFDGAEAALLAKMQKSLDPLLMQTKNAAYQEAVTASQANWEIGQHVEQLKRTDPDLVKFEKYLQAPVARRIEEARAAGKIKSPTDYVRESKSAIDAEVGELRNLGLVLRGQGRTEAQTRNQQVIASTTLVPNQVQSTQTPQQTTEQTPDTSVESYFERRRSQEQRNHGMV